MAGPYFAWDPAKNETNRKKHGVSFDEAATVFVDDHALLLSDPDHSDEEDRFILLGISSRIRILLVCHSYREAEDTIRIISARKAKRLERVNYERRLRRR